MNDHRKTNLPHIGLHFVVKKVTLDSIHEVISTFWLRIISKHCLGIKRSTLDNYSQVLSLTRQTLPTICHLKKIRLVSGLYATAKKI